ncbi:MAP kinase [Daldinia loculata]|uniref:MAP kinase n=1 Tax=Daldinia loculata TaxID=103429 RepID=UPI0020C478BB|nr:MAP kinase [Daldinia loculata]KAI1651474.1 MAP kinase [Daldinia loculata]
MSAAETSPRAVRFSQSEVELAQDKSKSQRPVAISTDSDGSGSSEDYTPDLHELERQDELGSLAPYGDGSITSSMASLAPNSVANNVGRPRGSAAEASANNVANGVGNRQQQQQQQQRPHVTRTPSSTYAPQRGPPLQPGFISTSTRSGSRRRDPADKFRDQEPAYLRMMRQDRTPSGYFDPYTPSVDYSDEESEGETPSSEGVFDDRFPNDETIMFQNLIDDTQPTEDDIKDPTNRERLEWHGMLAAVLTGDVVKQEKKRLIGTSELSGGKSTYKSELWLGIRSKMTGRSLAVQRRIIEEARGNLDRTIDEITRFEVQGETAAGKPAIEQVRDIVKKIEKCEGLYPSWQAMGIAHQQVTSQSFQEVYDVVMSWYNTNEMINTELSILKKWVGNEDLDFQRTKQRSPSTNGLSDETSFLDRLLKEDGLRSLHEDDETATQEHALKTKSLIRRSMLTPISTTIAKAKETLIMNSAAFHKRHLPPYIEELLTLISFPSRLIEEIIKVRVAYARKMKETTQQTPILQDQMISQFEILLKLAIRIKQENLMVSQPQPGWNLPPCIDESFDQVVLDALKYYFKMLNWKLSRNKNTFKEAEVLFQEWDFANEIGQHLVGGDIEVAEQFSNLTYKALNRLSQTFERELQRKPKESPDDMSKRYTQMLDTVRVRQRMLQRFSRMLSEHYENASDMSIALGAEGLRSLYERLSVTGHFLVDEVDGIQIIASPALIGRDHEVQSILRTCFHERISEDPTDPYVLILRPEAPLHWFGNRRPQSLNIESPDLKLGQMRLIADGSQDRLANARKLFLETIDMHLDLIVEARSNLHKVNTRLFEIRKVGFKLSNTFMDSVEIIRKQTKGFDCQDLIQTCFVFATEFGQRSLLYMDSNRRQMNNIKLTKLSLDWVSFICDDCKVTDRKSFRWAVPALEFAMGMTRGRQILGLGDDEYAKLRAKVSGCMSLLISHFDILGAKSNQAAQLERERIETLIGQFKRFDKNRMLDDEEAIKYKQEQRLIQLAQIDEIQRRNIEERQGIGRVLEVSNEVDRSLAYLSSSATNVTMRWQQGHFVGGGTFGNVYAAMNLDTGHLMAVKEIRLQDPKLIPQIATQIKDEMGVLEVLNHPNVVSYHGIEVHRDRVYIFMEFCSGGSLAALLEHGRIEDEQVVMVYALQLLEGLAYLHESGIAHRDIKPENILLDHNGVIKYVDFGAAKVIARQGRTLVHGLSATKPNKSMTGTPMYMSPEVIKGENPGRAGAVDVWSLGCVILEMVTGRRPWSNLDNEWAIMYNIAQGNPPQLPSIDQLSAQGIDFLNKCFVRDPKRRASAVELLQHEWIMCIRNQVVDPPTPSDTSSNSAQSDNATIPFPAYVEREINASSRLLPPTNMQAAQESARRAHIRESVSRARAESESAVPSTIYDILEREFGPSSSNSGP